MATRNRLITALALPLVIFLAGSHQWATSVDAPPQSPEWYPNEVSNWLDSTGRLQDQLSNPEYWLLRETQQDTKLADPYRAPELWAPKRGRVTAVRYPNRYGAQISAHEWAPPTTFVDPVSRRPGKGPFPAVIVINGAGDAEEEYWAFAQDLAEHGYVVLTFDPHGASDSAPSPESTYCDPNGSWRRPQEMGVREHGDCAGQNDNGVNSTVGQVPAVVSIAVEGRTGDQGTTDVQSLYEELEPNFVFGALDAWKWMVSSANPWRQLIDLHRMGVIGHSLGAYAAALVGNGDPQRRFRAAVAMDSYGAFQHGVRPTVPTLYEQSEQELFAGPRLGQPPPEALHMTRRDYASFVNRRIPSMFLVLKSSTHQEFAYVGPDAGQPASRYGQRVASYYTLAWLDRYVKGVVGARRLGDETLQRRDAYRRLRRGWFNRSIDGSSIGLGLWDVSGMANRPYAIAGRLAAYALSSYYVSRYALEGHRCDDMVRGCHAS